MSESVVRHVIVRGQVQGVGYRAWLEDAALLNGLQGWVRNRLDGSVEAVFAGPGETVQAVLAACRKGPETAQVQSVEEKIVDATALKPMRPGDLFSVLPTA